MRLSKKDLRALRAAALSLASDFCEGRGPALSNWSWCRCAIGYAFERAGLGDLPSEAYEEVDGLLPDSCDPQPPDDDIGYGYTCPFTVHGLLSHATQAQVRGKQDGAVVFPLLALADALDEAAALMPVKP